MDEQGSELNVKATRLSMWIRRSVKAEGRFGQTLREEDVKVTHEDLVRLNEYAKRWRVLGAYTSSCSLFDMIKSIVTAYAILSCHTEVGDGEYRFLTMLEP